MNETNGPRDLAVCAEAGVLSGIAVIGGQSAEMLCTEYAAVPSNDLIEYAIQRDGRTTLEIELAQRLALALDMLAENEMFEPRKPHYGHNA